MRIGLIAMSGIRAASEELTKIGLTLPGVIERNKIVASMPSLSLLTLAALTPPDVQVEYHEIKDLRQQGELPGGFDLVAIATFTAQVFDAYAVARHYRERGTAVVMGGLHVTKLPDEALEHCTSVVVGEAEPLWPQVVADARNGGLKRRYQSAAGYEYDLGDSPIPRYDLLKVGEYNRLTVQTSRGCPHLCDFCASSIFLTSRYKLKPVDRVIAEVRRITELWPRPFLEFADDNSFVHKKHYKELLTALREEHVSWFTEADISVADDPELLDLMRTSGCRQVLIGLESPSAGGLDGVEVRRNWKLRQVSRYERSVMEIQAHGITVNGCFILGLDGDGPELFDAIYDFAERTGLFEVQLTVLTPFPGTPLYDRLLAAGRILEPGAWNKCTLFDVNFQPARMSPAELQQGLVDLARRIYDPAFVQRRREKFFAMRRR
jgi:radical SAM superfamily enzyme YgiQ (UPF0313 family)